MLGGGRGGWGRQNQGLITPLLALPSDENGKDQGINVRQKVKEMIEFVQDDDRLREERKKAKKNKDKYIGVSSDSMGGFRSSKLLFTLCLLLLLTHL